MTTKAYAGYSKIHGKGMFARCDLKVGEQLVVPSSRCEGDGHYVVEDPAGGFHMLFNPYCFLNHSDDPNAVLYYDGEFTLEIIKSIKAKEEVTFDYEG